MNRKSFVSCILALFSLCTMASAGTETAVSDSLASIYNDRIRIEFDLLTGQYRTLDQKSGKVTLCDAYAEFDGVRTSDPGCERRGTAEAFSNELGHGKRLSVAVRLPAICEMLVQFTVYDERDYFVITTRYKNLGPKPVRLKNITAISGRAFVGSPVGQNYQTLDGNSGMHDTRVDNGKERESSNNLLAMFEEDGEKRVLLLGGLTYYDYAKKAAIVRESDGLRFRLWAGDPYGRKVEKQEEYVSPIRTAQNLQPTPYTFPVLDLWYASFWNKGTYPNTSSGAVSYMQDVVGSGFLKYTPVGIMLEPDSYDYPDNQQGWWDDAHFRQHGTYTEPYETSKKWAGKVGSLGGIPLLYFQTSRYSEDYARAHPEHVLFQDKQPRPDPAGWWADGQDHHWGYDFSNAGFRRHMTEVYGNLAEAGIRGVKYDYPLTGWADQGGFSDDTLTTAAHFRKIFELPKRLLGSPSYVSLRGDLADDIAIGVIDALRIENDNDLFIPYMARRGGLRWYKNRVLYYNYLDSKNPGKSQPCSLDGKRAMLTMNYVVSGKLMLAVGFDKLSPEEQHIISRTLPFHRQAKSARPVDAFSGKPWPEIYDFTVDDGWHQVVLYNANLTPGLSWADNWEVWKERYDLGSEMIAKTIAVELAGKPGFGGLGLVSRESYFIYDFWNDCLVGRYAGSDRLTQTLRPGEARVLSVHRVEKNPQFLSTDRHILQGYVDFAAVPAWDAATRCLKGTSVLVAGEPYRIVVACNGYSPGKLSLLGDRQATGAVVALKNDLVEIEIASATGGELTWSLAFANPGKTEEPK